MDFIMLHMLLSTLWKLATTLSEEKRGVGHFCTTEKEKTAREGESLTEGPLKAAAVIRGLIGMSRRLTIGSSLYTQEDRISILMCYKLGKRQKKRMVATSWGQREASGLNIYNGVWIGCGRVTLLWLILLKLKGGGGSHDIVSRFKIWTKEKKKKL